MKISLITTISGQKRIVDVDDENAPLITFHNEFSMKNIPEKIFDFLCKKNNINFIILNREFNDIDLDD